MKIGVITDCFGLPVDQAIVRASALGFDGVQIYATTGAFSPDALDAAARKSYRELLKKNNLEVSALCGDLGGHGFEVAEDNPEKIRKTKEIIDLAVKMETSVVTTHIGVIPEDTQCEKYKVMLSASVLTGS